MKIQSYNLDTDEIELSEVLCLGCSGYSGVCCIPRKIGVSSLYHCDSLFKPNGEEIIIEKNVQTNSSQPFLRITNGKKVLIIPEEESEKEVLNIKV